MSNDKNIENLNIPLWALPLRGIYRFVKKLLPNEQAIKQIEIKGIKYIVWANEDIGKKLLLLRSYEKNETDVFKKFVKKDDVCLDVGGNIGFYSLNLSSFLKGTGVVHVFEPIKRNVNVIELAAEINSYKNISVHRQVLSNTNGEVEMAIPEDDGAYAYINDDSDQVKAKELVACSTLDAFFKDNDLQKVDILKIDVEGAEGMVVEGAVELFSNKDNRPRLVMIELVNSYLERFSSDVLTIVNKMKGYGYKPYSAKNKGELVDFLESDVDKVFNVFFVCEN